MYTVRCTSAQSDHDHEHPAVLDGLGPYRAMAASIRGSLCSGVTLVMLNDRIYMTYVIESTLTHLICLCRQRPYRQCLAALRCSRVYRPRRWSELVRVLGGSMAAAGRHDCDRSGPVSR